MDLLKSDVRLSKFLSKVLRHKPEMIGLELDQNGWVDVEQLLTACRNHGVPMDRTVLERIVATNEKQRFAFSEDGQKIRANQGHSIAVDLKSQAGATAGSVVSWNGGTFSSFHPSKGIGERKTASCAFVRGSGYGP